MSWMRRFVHLLSLFARISKVQVLQLHLIGSRCTESAVVSAQVADALRQDARVILMEGTNLRYLQPADLPVLPQVPFAALSGVRACAYVLGDAGVGGGGGEVAAMDVAGSLQNWLKVAKWPVGK